MSKVFIGQTKLTLEVNTASDLIGYQTAEIRYENPNGQKGSFSATVGQLSPGLLVYNIQNANELNVAGVWKIWAHITFNDGKVSIGEPATLRVLRPGDN